MRACLLTLMLLTSGAAFAQDACAERCGSGTSACIGKCGGEPRCANGCSRQLNECFARCQGKPEKAASKTKKCTGANGKNIPCPDYREPPKAKTAAQPEEQYPNNAAKDLAKDPNFKVQP